MLYLKEMNLEDGRAEYEFYQEIPEDENGFTNPDAGVSLEEFLNRVIPREMNYS